jgi:hypothetical protein
MGVYFPVQSPPSSSSGPEKTSAKKGSTRAVAVFYFQFAEREGKSRVVMLRLQRGMEHPWARESEG